MPWCTGLHHSSQVHGRGLTISLDPSVALAATGPASMMPWAGDPAIVIDRFDGRAALDSIPEPGAEAGEEAEEGREQQKERRAINYER